MLSVGRKYPSDLTEEQWKRISKRIPEARHGGRPRTTSVKSVVNACFYVNRAGCGWRYLPKDYPPWQTVYNYFREWVKSGVWQQLNELLIQEIRASAGRSANPHLGIIDSQSVRAHYGECRGYDGFKKVKGRKRQILVDVMGFVHAVRIHGADLQDRREGLELAKAYLKKPNNLEKILADQGYNGCFVDYLTYYSKVEVTVMGGTKAKPNQQNMTPKRWIVERTFAWFNHFKRLARDYERKTSTSETMIYLAMIQLMLKRACPPDF